MYLRKAQIKAIAGKGGMLVCGGEHALTIALKVLFSTATRTDTDFLWTRTVADAELYCNGALIATSNEDGLAEIGVDRSGTIEIKVRPPAGRQSDGPAGHGSASNVDVASTPTDLMMFRPFTLTACVLVDEAGATFDDSQMIEIGTDRTAVSLSRNTVHARYYELSDDKKTLTIDWKPDFIKSPRLTRVWNRAIRFIILHRTGSDDMKSTLDKFVQPIGQGLPGSAHYVIDQDGFVVRMVQDEYGSHHTPRGHNYTYPEDGSFWRGRDDVQDSSIGIEVVAAPLGSIEDPQLNSLSSLVREIRHALAIPAKDVAGHIDVRLLGRISYGLLIGGTSCPNLSFPWYALGQRNATIRYQNEHDNEFNGEIEAKYGSVLPDDPAWAYNGSFTSAMWTQLASDLKEIGYSINRNDGVTTDPPEYDAIRQALFVFRYRFHGESIIGSLDRRLAATIESVLANIRNG